MIAMLLALISIIPHDTVVRDSVDLTELQHFYDDNGRLVFDQLIYYDYSWLGKRYQVRAWRLVKDPAQLPRRDWVNGGYSATWLDADALRNVRSTEHRETWEQYDVELEERYILPQEKRRPLSLPKPLVKSRDGKT